MASDAPWVVRELSAARAMAISGSVCEEERDWSEPHDRAVAGGELVDAAAPWLTGAFERGERLKDGSADVEALAGAAVMSFTLPAQVSRQLVDGVESLGLEQALREAEGHRRVVCPLPWLEIEGTAADHVVDGVEGAG